MQKAIGGRRGVHGQGQDGNQGHHCEGHQEVAARAQGRLGVPDQHTQDHLHQDQASQERRKQTQTPG